MAGWWTMGALGSWGDDPLPGQPAEEDLQGGDAAERVAIVGRQVFVENYTQPSGAMPGMVHLFDIGQSFVLPDAEARVRVVGRYATKGQVLDRIVFLPLATAQRLYGLEGRVTHIFVTVDSPANVDRVAQEVRVVLAAQQQE